MTTMLEKLKQKLASSSKEDILRKWNSGKEWDNCGPKVQEFINEISFHLEDKVPQKDFGNVKINDNLGSNLYSNLFYLKPKSFYGFGLISAPRLSFLKSITRQFSN